MRAVRNHVWGSWIARAKGRCSVSAFIKVAILTTFQNPRTDYPTHESQPPKKQPLSHLEGGMYVYSPPIFIYIPHPQHLCTLLNRLSLCLLLGSYIRNMDPPGVGATPLFRVRAESTDDAS